MTKTVQIGVLVIFAAFFLAACGRTDADPVVARAGGIDIRAGDVRIHLEYATEFMQMEYWHHFGSDTFDFNALHPDGMTFYRAAREEAVRTVVFFHTFSAMAERFGVGLSDAELDEIVAQIEEEIEFVGEEEFYEWMHEIGFRDRYHMAQLVAAQDVLDNLIVFLLTHEEHFEPFARHIPPEPELPELLGAMHILTMPNRFDTPEEAYAQANALLARLHAGEDFIDLMHEYSHDEGGLWDFPFGYTFHAGLMHPPFEDAVRALAVGETSGVVESPSGYHIIRRVEPVEVDWFHLMNEQPPTLHSRMVDAILIGIQEMVDGTAIEFFPALDDL